MTFSEMKATVDPDEATHLIALTRLRLADLREISGDESFERKRALLQIIGYPRARDEQELENLIRTLKRAAYPGRTGGMH